MKKYNRSGASVLFTVAITALATIKSNEIYNYLNKNIFNNADTYKTCAEDILSESLKDSKYKAAFEKILAEMEKDGVTKKIDEYCDIFANYVKEADSETDNIIKTKIKQLNDDNLDLFKKYNLTDEQIQQLGNVCVREQGHNEKGIAAEASLMANRFEANANNMAHKKTGAEGLYEYVRNGSEKDVFFDTKQNGGKYNTPHLMDTGEAHDGSKCIATEEETEIVKKVLVEGKRTLPAYVNEQDYIGSVASATNNGQEISDTRDKSQYIPGVTKIKNKGMDDSDPAYTFYCFLNEDKESDPFSYTSEEYREEVGEAHYDYETWELINAPENTITQSEQEEISDENIIQEDDETIR